MIVPTFFEDRADNVQPSHQEGQVSADAAEVDPLLVSVSDEDLLKEIDDRLSASEPGMRSLRNQQQINRQYYVGDQLKSFDILHWQLPSVENRIFMSVEVLIPLITANAGDPDIHCLAYGEAQEEEVEHYVQTLTSMLMYDYNVTYSLKNKIRKIVRNWFINQVGVGKFRYDPLTGEPVFDVVDPRNIILPTKDSPKGWVAEYKEDTLANLLVMFPKSKSLLEEMFWKQGGEIPETVLGTLVGYYEYWRHSFVAWKINDKIIDKRKNPNWDWDGIKKQTTQEVKFNADGGAVVNPVIDTYKYRILDRPRHPYFFFNHFVVDDVEYDTTGYIEQAIPIQDLINKRKRQITTIADDAGLLIASGAGGQGIKKSEFEKYDGSPRSTMWISDGNPSAVFTRLQGASVNQGMILDLQDSRTASDNLFGTQNATRGQASGSESGVARQVLRQGDVTRVGPLAESVEDFLQQVYMYDLQMRMLFTTQDYTVPANGNVGADEPKNLTFNRDRVPFIKVDEMIVIDGVESMESYMRPVPITLTVRRNSTLARDPVSEYERDLESFKAGLLDPESFYEQTNQPNPKKKLERLYRWHNFPFTMLSKKTQEELMPLITNPVSAPPERRVTNTINFKDLPATAQTGLLQESGILKGEAEAFQAEQEIRQAQLAAEQQQATENEQAQSKTTPPTGQ